MAANSKRLTVSAEDYLERIHELIETKGYARVSDIAALLSLTRPTVSIMVQRLSRDGYLTYEKYRGLTLTALGAEVARRIQTRHVLLTEFLGMLGLDRAVVSRDVEASNTMSARRRWKGSRCWWSIGKGSLLVCAPRSLPKPRSSDSVSVP